VASKGNFGVFRDAAKCNLIRHRWSKSSDFEDVPKSLVCLVLTTQASFKVCVITMFILSCLLFSNCSCSVSFVTYFLLTEREREPYWENVARGFSEGDILPVRSRASES